MPKQAQLNLPQVVVYKRNKRNQSVAMIADLKSTATENDTFANISERVVDETEKVTLDAVVPAKDKKKTVRIADIVEVHSGVPKRPADRCENVATPVQPTAPTPTLPSTSSHALLFALSMLYILYLSCVCFGDGWLLGLYTNMAADPPFKTPSLSSTHQFNTSITHPPVNSLTTSTQLQWRIDGSSLLAHSGEAATLRVGVAVDGTNITFPAGNTFSINIDQQIELSTDLAVFGVSVAMAHLIEVTSELEVSGQLYRSADKVAFYLLPQNMAPTPAAATPSLPKEQRREEEISAHRGGLLAAKSLSITSLARDAASADVIMSLSVLSRFVMKSHRLLLLVNDSSFDVTENAAAAALRDADVALLDITLDSSLLSDYNTVTVNVCADKEVEAGGACREVVAFDSKTFHFNV